MPELILDEVHGSLLTQVARAAIREALGGPQKLRPSAAPLDEVGASFVTLYRGEVLHGCIGSLEPHARLADDVAHNAVAAALRDPRNVPLALTDVELLTVEVSVLSPLERIPCKDEAEAVAVLRPHRDGVLLRHGHRRSTFLPQVWKSLPNPYEFLAELRTKAGLPQNFWANDLEVYRYHIQKFVEEPRM